MRKIHAVLTYQLENNCYGCINRDKNAVMNMKKIVDYYLKHKERPERYRRGYDLDNIKEEIPKKKPVKKKTANKTIKDTNLLVK
jgi:hypothetical protein